MLYLRPRVTTCLPCSCGPKFIGELVLAAGMKTTAIRFPKVGLCRRDRVTNVRQDDAIYLEQCMEVNINSIVVITFLLGSVVRETVLDGLMLQLLFS